MKADYRIGFLLLVLAKVSMAQYNSSCFKATPVFGTTLNSIPVNDMTWFTSTKFNNNLTVTQINLCGMFQAFEGIQVFLSGSGSSLSLNSVGRAVSCQNNVLAPNTYITQVQLAYNANGVTFIKFTTNTAVIFSRGVITQTDSAFTQLFTQTQPFIGVLGY